MGRKIIDSTRAYAGMQAQSVLALYGQLGLTNKLDDATKQELTVEAAHAP
jgi:hypothetical protein